MGDRPGNRHRTNHSIPNGHIHRPCTATHGQRAADTRKEQRLMKIAFPFGSSQLLRLGLVATMATGVLATVAGHGTMAYFTTQTASTANVFTAGTLHLQATDSDQGPA